MSDSVATPITQPHWRLETWFNQLPKDQIAKLKIHFDEFIKADKLMQFVSPKTVMFSDGLHYADSIYAMNAIFSDKPDIDTLYDLGSGAGFPGIIGAVLYPHKKFILVEPDKRKSEYLAQCITKMRLENTSVLESTVEALPAGSVKYAVSRGLSNISKLILNARKAVDVGGAIYHMRAENWGMEVADIPTQLCSVWSPGLVKEYRLPIGEVRFAVVKTDKIS
jgi:16S rRNA (guanine527-N7)-methyltransferase